MESASSASEERRWSASARPTTRREGVDGVCLWGEVALQQVGLAPGRRVGDGGALAAPLGAPHEATEGHQAGDALAPRAQALLAQRPADARRAIGAA
jgi:hypothetical protein